MPHRSFFFHSEAPPEIQPCTHCGQPAVTAVGSFDLLKPEGERGQMVYSCARCKLLNSLLAGYNAMEGMIVKLSQDPGDAEERAFVHRTFVTCADRIHKNKMARIVLSSIPGHPDRIAYDKAYIEPLEPASLPSPRNAAPADDDVENRTCFDCGGASHIKIALAAVRNDPALDGDVLVCAKCLKDRWIASTQDFIEGAEARLAQVPASYSGRQKVEETIKKAEYRLQILTRYTQSRPD